MYVRGKMASQRKVVVWSKISEEEVLILPENLRPTEGESEHELDDSNGTQNDSLLLLNDSAKEDEPHEPGSTMSTGDDSDVQPPNNDLTGAINRHNLKGKTPPFVYIVAFFSIIGGFLFGYDTSVIAGALLELEEDFELDSTKRELIVSITILAAACGAVLGGPSNEMIGRKRTIMIASVIFGIGSVVMAAAPTGGGTASWSWLMVLCGRFIVGLGIGEFTFCDPFCCTCSYIHNVVT